MQECSYLAVLVELRLIELWALNAVDLTFLDAIALALTLKRHRNEDGM